MDGKHSSQVLPLSSDLDSVDKRKAFTPSEEIEDLYREIRARVRQDLVTVPGRICLTVCIWADIWEMNSNKKFICITSRWCDDDWAVQERILEFRAFSHPYYPEDMDQWLCRWGIERKLLGMCFDDESHQSLGLADSLRRSCLVSDESRAAGFLNIQCFDHLLDSILHSSLQRIEPIVDKIRGAISYILERDHHKEFYELAQRSYGVDVTKKLICDYFHGGWNSKYVMLDRALVYKEALLNWGIKDEVFKEKFSLGNDEWEKVTTLVNNFLTPLYRIISAFPETKYVTSNMYLRSIYEMYTTILMYSWRNQGSHHRDFMGGVSKDAGEKLCNYFLDNSLVLSCAVILDPYCKEDFAENCYRVLCRGCDESMVKEYVNRNRAALRSLFDEYKEKFPCLSSHETELGSELDRYLEEEISDDPNIDEELSFDQKFDILEYWKKTACTNRYPVLAMLARDILAIPVSSSILPESEEAAADFYMVGKKKKKVTVIMGEPRTHEDLQVR